MTKKLCKDCRHSQRDWLLGWKFAKCKVSRPATMSLVTGASKQNAMFCDTARLAHNKCGPQGAMFEAKKQ